MDASKPWYSSVTVWGGILAVLAPTIGSLLKYNFTSDDINQAANALSLLGAGIGGVIAIIGRFKASKSVTLTKQAST